MIDSSAYLALLWQPIRWVIPFVLIVGGLRLALKNWLSGKFGEMEVANAIHSVTPDSLHDVVLLDGRGGLTQIDHLALTSQGVIVVETKAWSGWIFGRARDEYWTQKFYRQSFRVRNPLRQNYGHVLSVKRLVDGAIPVVGVVVMAGDAHFPKRMPEGVFSINSFSDRFLEHHDPLKVPNEWRDSWQRLCGQVRCDKQARKAHRQLMAARYGGDFRPHLGAAMIVAGLLLTGWFWVT